MTAQLNVNRSHTLQGSNWIDGQWTDAGEKKDSVDPATGDVIGSYALAGEPEAQQAISAARRAFEETGWRNDRALRARVLNAMADRFEARQDELVELLGRENGKVAAHARIEMSLVPATLRFNAALALADYGRAMKPGPSNLGMVLKEPAGVAGIIAPWNSPVALAIRSLAPALAAGTTVVVSLPHQTALINSLMADVIAETPELPAGVVNLVTGGRTTGDALVRSPDVPVLSFTGSTATGKAISATAADNLKRLGLELGGKSPLVVLDDADLTIAVPLIVAALTVFTGQFCMTGSRLLVQAGVANAVRDALTVALGAVRVGPASDPTSEMGPMIDKANVSRVDTLVEDAIAAGAKVLLRGGPPEDEQLDKGAFYRPTLLEVEDSDLPIVQHEVFGPVLTMQVFDDDQEAITMANATEYGLCASVFSRDIDRSLAVAAGIQAGTVWINDWAAMDDQFEEGGYKSSGLGRMRGLSVMDDFVEYKHIAIATR